MMTWMHLFSVASYVSATGGAELKLEYALPVSARGSPLHGYHGVSQNDEVSRTGTALLERDGKLDDSVPDTHVEERVMSELLTEDAHTEILRRKEKEGQNEVSPLPEEGTTLNRDQGELDEESGNGCIPFMRPDYWDATRHFADSMEETLLFRINRIKKNSHSTRCGITDWKFEADVEVASQMISCRIWRVFFSWVSVQMERELGFSPDWRDANSSFAYYSWLWKIAQPQTSFYDRVWMLSKDGFGSSMRGPTNRESFSFGNERRSALYEEIVAELTTRPIYFHLVDVFNAVSGEDLDTVLPYFGSYGWYHLGRTRDARKIIDMVDTMIESIGRDDPDQRDADRQILGVENFRAALAEKKILQRYCPKVYLDARQYTHTSFSPWKHEHMTDPPIWNTREEPLACSRSQVLLRLRTWHEVNRRFTLVDPLLSPASNGIDANAFESGTGSRSWLWWVLLLFLVTTVASVALLYAHFRRNQRRRR